MPGRPLHWGSVCGENTTLSNLNSTHPLFTTSFQHTVQVMLSSSNILMTWWLWAPLSGQRSSHTERTFGFAGIPSASPNRQHIVVYWPSKGEWGGTSQHIVPPLVKQEGTSQQKAIFWEERDEVQSLTLICWLDQSGCNPTAAALTMLFTAINSSQCIQLNSILRDKQTFQKKSCVKCKQTECDV